MMKINTLFISDIHLGNPNSNPKALLKVLKEYDFNKLVIIGDFLDLTYMKRNFFWNQHHTKVIQKILKISSKIEVVYILGNHDAYLRELIDDNDIFVGKILLCDSHIHTTSKNEKIYITHGDILDGFVATSKWLYALGDYAYEFSIWLNKIYNNIRKLFNKPYWSLSAYLKVKVKNVIKFLTDYTDQAMKLISKNDCDSIMIGHIHHPEIKEIENNKYYNTGDFCENLSYIIEDLEGNLILLCQKEY